MVGWILFAFVVGWILGVATGVKAMKKQYDEEKKK